MSNWPWPDANIRELLLDALDETTLTQILSDSDDLRMARRTYAKDAGMFDRVQNIMDYCVQFNVESILLEGLWKLNKKKCRVYADDNVLSSLITEAAPKTKSLMSEDDLVDRLLTIDFDPHTKVWNRVTETNQTMAFVVHGKALHGHTALVYRLAQEIPNWQTSKKVLIDAGDSGGDVKVLWWRAAKGFVGNAMAPKQDVLDALCDHLRTKNVVIFIHGAQTLAGQKTLTQWVNEFWCAAVQQAQTPEFQKPRQDNKTYLIMFLVDYGGNSPTCGTILTQWSLDEIEAWANDIGLDCESTIPICLPQVEQFDQNKLTNWLQNRMTQKMLPIKQKISILKLLSETENGIPELVYEKICSLDSHQWENISKRLRDIS